MTTHAAAATPPFGRAWLTNELRRHQDVSLAAALGAIVALLMLALPMQAALASSVIGAFVIVAFVDTRVAVLSLILVRASIDVTSTVPLLSASGSSNVNATAMMSFLIIGLGSAHIALHRIDIFRMPLVKPFALFLVISFAGIGLAHDHNRALEEWLRVVGAFMVYVLVLDLMRSRDDWRWLIRVMLLSAVVPIAYGIYQYFAGTGNHDTAGYNRIDSTFVHPSPYAFYLLQLLPVAGVFLFFTRSKLARVWLVVMIPLMVFSIYATETRAAWIGLVVISMVFVWVRARWAMLVIPFLAGALFFAIPSARARIEAATSGQCISNTNCQSSVLWRTKQWEETVRLAPPAQLLSVGTGLGSVDVALGSAAHNEYLRLLVETGLAGLVVMIVLYRRLLIIALAAYRRAPPGFDRALVLAFISIWLARVVIGGTDNVMIVVLEWYFWAFAALIVTMSGVYTRHPQVAQPQTRGEEPAKAPAGSIA